jgi:hypothetical protein
VQVVGKLGERSGIVKGGGGTSIHHQSGPQEDRL